MFNIISERVAITGTINANPIIFDNPLTVIPAVLSTFSIKLSKLLTKERTLLKALPNPSSLNSLTNLFISGLLPKTITPTAAITKETICISFKFGNSPRNNSVVGPTKAVIPAP